MRLVITILAMVAAVTVASAADRDARPRDGDWEGTGVVLAVLPPPSDLHATRPVIVIQHEAIPGLMDARMAMPFIAASTDLFRDLHVGDRIGFVLKDTPGALLVVRIQRNPPAATR